MDRRKAIKVGLGTLAASGAGAIAWSTIFRQEEPKPIPPKKIDLVEEETKWSFHTLNSEVVSQVAYDNYSKGSCMYGVFTGIISQLAEIIGEPFKSFPVHMMKYGHGGIGGYGTTCGTLNGAAAAFGLLIKDKKSRDALINDLFSWYENTATPNFTPNNPVFDYDPPTVVAESVLCHASATNWSKKNEKRIDSDERKERCRRLSGEVAAKATQMLNQYFEDSFTTAYQDNETVNTCMSCHSSKGKLANTTGKMTCTSCHEKSLGHKVFGDAHYELMDTIK